MREKLNTDGIAVLSIEDIIKSKIKTYKNMASEYMNTLKYTLYLIESCENHLKNVQKGTKSNDDVG